ncbi:hypothetical protein [Ruminococcus flavefaciens]|uniref:hypothetical protein n=1 Tax=Ruminococcus flavefaciens TaxID=1265 RepID=UPI0026EC283C|nr:hypothetical protein [Ruminococcus flavefaciens]MDD7515966.1 hypothetical protein [Ruminococcus flavefaciens]MDY5691665.1 hypothetical protein [Ruminococcus flavefaciens]
MYIPDKEQQAENRKLSIEMDMKAERVDHIIEMTSPEPPKRRFEIDIPSQKRAANRACLSAAAADLLADLGFYITKTSITGEKEIDEKIAIIAAVIGVALMAVTVFREFLSENIARVIGEELKISDKSYFTCDIERICCKNDDVKVISGGKPVLRLTKAHDGCGELMKWARAYEIPIENNIGLPSLKVRILALAGVFAFLAVCAVLMILLLIKS